MQGKTDTPGRQSPGKYLAVFGYAWLMIGLVTGTIVLVFLVRGIIGALHGLGMGQTAEDRSLIVIILAFVVLSFLLTRWFIRRVYRSPSARNRRLALGALLLPGVAAMWAWSNPTALLANFAGSTSTTLALAGGPEFVFGPYPQPDRLAELKQQGFTAVVSLQHPSVVVELKGIATEKAATEKLGLTLIQAPMLPWVSENEASLEKIREIARTGSGKYYVHCGLGRDRVNVVRRVIESMSTDGKVRLAKAKDLMDAKGLEQREAPFQNGRLFELRPGVWLTPIPNKMELSEVLFGAEGRVLLVLDPADSAQQAWSTSTQKQLRDYVIPFEVVPFTEADAADSGRVALLVNRIRSAREGERVTVIVPRTPFGSGTRERQTQVAQAILRSFNVSWARSDQRSSSRSDGSSGR